MKHTLRILCAVLALSMLLTGCSLWKPTLSGVGDVAATYGDGQEISTGEYLAYLYMNFENIYQSYAQYEAYGMDPWEQTIPYGDEDEKLLLEDYIVRITQDTIKNQIVLDKMLKDNNLSWIEEEYEEVKADAAEMEADAYLPLGISDEHFNSVYEKLMLNQRSVFFGLYGKDGVEEVKDEELRKYFDENYLSYKIISVSLTDSEGQELDKKAKAEQIEKLEGYLKICNEKGFEAAMDAYNKDNAEEGEEVEASKDEDNRNNEDATAMDEKLVEAIRTVKVGKAKVVEYSAGGSTPTAALIMRLDINDPKSLYEDSYENILISLKADTFEEIVDEKVAELNIEFDEDVLETCTPKQMLADLQKISG